MFVDFDKVFNKQQESIPIPDGFIDYLNKKLPSGIKYIADNKGNCIITSDDNSPSFTLGGFIIILSQEDKKILGASFSQNDILKLYYNRQAEILLQLQKEGFITINGKEMPINQLIVNPHYPIKFQDGQFFMSPPPFPEPFYLEIGTQNIKRNLLVKRIPHNSIDTIAFESIDNQPLSLNYTMKEKDNSLSLNISYDIKKAKNVRDILDTAEIYNAFWDGEGYLGNQIIEGTINTNNVRRFSDTSIRFWNKVYDLEEYLNISFSIPIEEITFETICLVEQLYQNLILKNPIKELGKPDTLDFKWSAENRPDFEDSIGKPVYFEFEATKTFELFGEKITLHGLTGIINCIFSKVIEKGGVYKFILEDLHADKPKYFASIFFKSEDEMIDYKNNKQKERITSFHNAKKASEYLNSEE